MPFFAALCGVDELFYLCHLAMLAVSIELCLNTSYILATCLAHGSNKLIASEESILVCVCARVRCRDRKCTLINCIKWETAELQSLWVQLASRCRNGTGCSKLLVYPRYACRVQIPIYRLVGAHKMHRATATRPARSSCAESALVPVLFIVPPLQPQSLLGQVGHMQCLCCQRRQYSHEAMGSLLRDCCKATGRLRTP